MMNYSEDTGERILTEVEENVAADKAADADRALKLIAIVKAKIMRDALSTLTSIQESLKTDNLHLCNDNMYRFCDFVGDQLEDYFAEVMTKIEERKA